MSYTTSSEMRLNPLFLRNEFEGAGRWGIPLVKKQQIDLSDVSLIAYSEIPSKKTGQSRKQGSIFSSTTIVLKAFTVNLKDRWKSCRSTSFS